MLHWIRIPQRPSIGQNTNSYCFAIKEYRKKVKEQSKEICWDKARALLDWVVLYKNPCLSERLGEANSGTRW